ncbi:transglutaminase domain-containing protein [Mesobacillus harenae]|uniref:transglutaminase domain-containing protein n=1 Tax=Mesobacillus harenae TaxID=2213203 RepID=UPI001580832F
MTAENRNNSFVTLLLYSLSFLLLWEWLRPLKQLTETGNIHVFLIFLLISLLLSYLGMPIAAGFFIKIVFIIYSMQFLYFEGSFFMFDWMSPMWSDVKMNMQLVLNSQWTELTSLFRTLLFFILLWLMSYLIQYWLINRKQIFVFFFMTMTYITVLDTFTTYEAENAIIRTVTAGFAVMGMLTFYRLLDRESFQRKAALSRRWMIPLAIMILVSVSLGFAAPKAEPLWPDPVPFITSYNTESGEGEGGTRRVGYGTDDSRLGGPFEGDNEVVFTAEAEARHYWKVETKDIYTGRGWIAEETDARLSFLPGDEVPIHSLIEGIDTEERTSTVFMEKGYQHVQYPLGIQQIQAGKSNSFEMNPVTEKIYSLETSRPAALDTYSVNYLEPAYQVADLRNITELGSEFGNQFINRYTQLPPELPARVKELAEEVTAEHENWFDKTRAIESYFRSSGFTYDQRDVALPGQGADYVDEFLFYTKQGYCDNFSTSMVVMLRSVGIPSRWVKGYTEGEYRSLGEGNARLYEVTNNNAHSWVEVFFPNVGWVPFEPTQGFSANVDFVFDTTPSGSSENEPEEENEAEPVAATPDQPEDKGSTGPSGISQIWAKVSTFFYEQWEWLLGTAALTIALFFLGYRKRYMWMPAYYIFRYKSKNNDEYIEKAYIALLGQLDRIGLKRKSNQTLREYAAYVDQFFSSKDMRRLTSYYEQFLYRGELKDGTWNEVKQLWENLIKKTTA